MQGWLCKPLAISSYEYNADSQSLQDEQMVHWEVHLVSPRFSQVLMHKAEMNMGHQKQV